MVKLRKTKLKEKKPYKQLEVIGEMHNGTVVT